MGRDIFVLLDNSSVIFSNGLVSLVVESDLSQAFALLQERNEVFGIFVLGKDMAFCYFFHWNDESLWIVAAEIDRVVDLLLKIVLELAGEGLN